MKHTPVLLQQAIERLDVKKGHIYIDATFGEGGYSKEILKRGGKVLGIDLDSDQLKNLSFKFSRSADFKLVQGNFSDIEKIARKNDFFPSDGVVFDLGLSMRQIEKSQRGFSYRKENEVLDMRIDTSQDLTAFDLIEKTSLEELQEIFIRYSEEINSRKIAEEIKKTIKIRTVLDLKRAIDRALGFKSEKTYARIFQALRIAVNDELGNLRKGLEGAIKVLKKGGRLVVISFHSVEDRIVKQFFKENRLKKIDKKPVKGAFSFERSAKLRAVIV